MFLLRVFLLFLSLSLLSSVSPTSSHRRPSPIPSKKNPQHPHPHSPPHHRHHFLGRDIPSPSAVSALLSSIEYSPPSPAAQSLFAHLPSTHYLASSCVSTSLPPYYYLTCEYPNQLLDHFNTGTPSPSTWTQRFIVNSTWWSPPSFPGDPSAGPIFFYTGNEGDINLFATNTGFVWDICPQFNCLLVFAEHRYYGTSLPFGPHSYDSVTELQYLSSEQALADYAQLLQDLKSDLTLSPDIPIISFGGSYGGMLTSWFRQKYPNVVAGGIAGSAPIWQFGPSFPAESFSLVVSNDFLQANQDCGVGISKFWNITLEWGSSPDGLNNLNKAFKACQNTTLKSLSDVENILWGHVSAAITYMPMADYPYPASFLGDMPAWPVNYSCSHGGFHSGQSDSDIVNAVAYVTAVFYNSTLSGGGDNGNEECANLDVAGAPTLGNDTPWDYQACSEMILPSGQAGWPTDILYPSPWDLQATILACQQQFPGVSTRPNQIEYQYGITPQAWKGASNIFFSNGVLDPWHPGGVLSSISDSLPAFVIQDGAHHLDLRSANPNDPPGVIECRKKEVQYINSWIAGFGSPMEMEEAMKKQNFE